MFKIDTQRDEAASASFTIFLAHTSIDLIQVNMLNKVTYGIKQSPRTRFKIQQGTNSVSIEECYVPQISLH